MPRSLVIILGIVVVVGAIIATALVKSETATSSQAQSVDGD